MPERVWVLGTRTDAGVGKIRLAVFPGRKRIPLKQEHPNDLETKILSKSPQISRDLLTPSS
ncbi:MAG: hypothetical protein EWV40_07560 [Microcystis flos-aquae Mf_WU_F_19750830_S460]|uniref:Uncharacterized protein n=1 Tax=Microcystis flos-aquae Mf_WU_F_19750830_S460 TaxID=2486237 RepID=A0A552LUG9_9CHRO|nr:MAG: hypothetical protein EWV40_07560 [Microcystis flos-aquae Mf_WU_F_19750830_S460]